MFALILLFSYGFYFLLLILATWLCRRWARKKGWGVWGCRAAGSMGFLLVFLPVFWDYIPTKVMYANYCKTQAGGFQYKTPEQWRVENPGVELIKPYTDAEQREMYLKGLEPKIMINGKKTTASVVHNSRISTFGYGEKMPLSIHKFGRLVVDVKTGEILAEDIDFQTKKMSWKLWLDERSCGGRIKNNTIDIYNLINVFANKLESNK